MAIVLSQGRYHGVQRDVPERATELYMADEESGVPIGWPLPMIYCTPGMFLSETHYGITDRVTADGERVFEMLD
jgi:hypothetical protein